VRSYAIPSQVEHNETVLAAVAGTAEPVLVAAADTAEPVAVAGTGPVEPSGEDQLVNPAESAETQYALMVPAQSLVQSQQDELVLQPQGA